MTVPQGDSAVMRWIKSATKIEANELAAALLSFLFVFILMAAYFILRPVRDEMGIRGGVEQLHWTFTATFLVMLLALPLFGAAAARLPRRRLLPAVRLSAAPSRSRSPMTPSWPRSMPST